MQLLAYCSMAVYFQQPKIKCKTENKNEPEAVEVRVSEGHFVGPPYSVVLHLGAVDWRAGTGPSSDAWPTR